MVNDELFPADLTAAPFRGSLASERVTGDLFPGIHRSRRCGNGMEFEEFRPYVPGDELRHVDWNVYRRSGQLLVRQYRRDPRQRHLVVLDDSPSICYRQDRRQAAWRVAALLCGAILAAGDGLRLRLTSGFERTFNSGGEDVFQSVLEVLSDLYERKAGKGELLSVFPCALRGWVISDFLDDRGLGWLEVQCRKAGGFTPLRVYDRDEEHPVPGQEFRMVDVETGRAVMWSADAECCADYERRLAVLKAILAATAARVNDRAYEFAADSSVRQLIACILTQGGKEA